MSQSDKVFAGSIPKLYDSHLVPLIFEGFAEDLARRVAALSPGVVLETAAGSGVVTRSLAAKLAATARYVVTDLNQPMLDHAAIDRAKIAASTGSKRTPLHYPSRTQCLMWSAVSSV